MHALAAVGPEYPAFEPEQDDRVELDGWHEWMVSVSMHSVYNTPLLSGYAAMR